MSFVKKNWENKGESGYENSKVNAENLNNLEDRIEDAIDEKLSLSGGEMSGGLSYSNSESLHFYITSQTGNVMIRSLVNRVLLMSDLGIRAVNYANNSYVTIEASQFVQASDEKLKRDIKEIQIEESVNLIKNLSPKTYILKNDEGGKIHRGLIAQDVKKICNDLGLQDEIYEKTVLNDEEIYLLNYTELIADLINCIKFLLEKES